MMSTMTTTASIEASRWTQHRPVRSTLVVGVLALLVVGTTAVFVLLVPRDTAGVVTVAGAVVGGASTLVVLARNVRARFARGRLAVRTGDGHLVVPGDAPTAYALLGVAGGYLAFFLGIGLLAVTSSYDGAWAPVVVTAVVLALGAPMIVRLVRGHYRLNRLELTPTEVRSHGYVRTYALAWDDVLSVTLRVDPAPVAVLEGRVPPTVTGPRETLGESSVGGRAPTEVHLPIATAGSSLDAIAELVDFYRSHPAARPELGDDRAVQRIRSGLLGPTP
ncbi:hypothetical protein C3E78_00260 [Aeromicrobium chenweiae]|uniref:PH domain-containing protein n=2 Tax=Aeromicrobium chenweiae TaxID=2079793 RepID=A0A2S0WHH8_9ACTN|nr:hypothetical protein C3E78_00260 [Aeromicrobium chenweiae]